MRRRHARIAPQAANKIDFIGAGAEQTTAIATLADSRYWVLMNVSMQLHEVFAYLSSLLLASTFYLKTMIPLRVSAIAANLCLIVFTALVGLYPVLVIQALILPLNVMRLLQIQKATRRIRQATAGDLNLDALARFMKPESHKSGDVLFRSGDTSDKMYLIRSGTVSLEGLGKTLTAGEVFGEIGIVAPEGLRTATAICADDCELLSITQAEVSRLYYLDPGFGWYLIRLITQRLLHNLETARTDQANPGSAQ